MCEFISWIEKEGQVLFLTAENIDSEHGKKTLEGSLDNDFIGHRAIRQFYGPDGKSLSGGAERENQDFWDGNLPQKIKDAWNKGELDGMMRYLQQDDLEYIVKNAPSDFAAWTVTQRYGKDYQAMMKDGYWLVRLAGMTAMQDYKAMKKDSHRTVRLLGMAATRDYAAMKKDGDWPTRLLGMAATRDYAAMMKDSHWTVRLFEMAAAQDYAAMKEDDDWTVRLFGMAATQDYAAMKEDGDCAVRLLGMALTQDYAAMKKDCDPTIRLAGIAATYDLEKLVRPGL